MVFLTLLTPAGYQQYCRNKHSQLKQRRNSPETGKENMQVCPAITHSRLNTLRPWMQESESSVRVPQIFCRLVHAEKQIKVCIPRPATWHSSMTLLNHCKPTAEPWRLQQPHHWTIEPTTKLLLNLRVYNKVTAELLNLQQSHHWTIESTKLLLNHLVYKKDTTQPSILQQTHHWTIECTTELLLNRRVYNKITAEPLSL